ncbi:MAG: S41 family peptidase, partial [Treponema sp.]|nr:S41 family peptidase [Treponema sp.]
DSWNDYEMSALLENANTGERLSIAIRLRALSDFEGEEILFDEFELNGVPVVVNRTLAPELRLGEAGARMRESGAALRGKSAIVFDLRGHSGGVLDPMLDWVRALTGKRPLGRAFASFGLASRTNGGFVGGDPIWTESVFSTASTQPLPNESLIVVLMDNYIASAGELLVGRLRELENVIFVGANTMGVLLTADLKRTALPLSGIHVIYGAELNLRPDFSQFEGVGFMPDLWVPPDQSLERVLAFIERYGLLRAAQ